MAQLQGFRPDGWGQEFKGGAAYLAIRQQVPVVPVHIAGTDKILPKGSNRPRPGSTVLSFGDPIIARPGEDARRLSVRIEAGVAALADEATSDWWQARQRAHAGATPSLSGPDVVSWRRAWLRSDPARSQPRVSRSISAGARAMVPSALRPGANESAVSEPGATELGVPDQGVTEPGATEPASTDSGGAPAGRPGRPVIEDATRYPRWPRI